MELEAEEYLSGWRAGYLRNCACQEMTVDFIKAPAHFRETLEFLAGGGRPLFNISVDLRVKRPYHNESVGKGSRS